MGVYSSLVSNVGQGRPNLVPTCQSQWPSHPASLPHTTTSTISTPIMCFPWTTKKHGFTDSMERPNLKATGSMPQTLTQCAGPTLTVHCSVGAGIAWWQRSVGQTEPSEGCAPTNMPGWAVSYTDRERGTLLAACWWWWWCAAAAAATVDTMFVSDDDDDDGGVGGEGVSRAVRVRVKVSVLCPVRSVCGAQCERGDCWSCCGPGRWWWWWWSVRVLLTACRHQCSVRPWLGLVGGRAFSAVCMEAVGRRLGGGRRGDDRPAASLYVLTAACGVGWGMMRVAGDGLRKLLLSLVAEPATSRHQYYYYDWGPWREGGGGGAVICLF